MSDTSRDNGSHELLFQVGRIMIWYLVSSLILGLAGIGIYVYYLRKGQFDDPEDVKYQMFREDERN